ncbi:MAG: sugar ABC transporter permease [Chloroflexi bacterium]|nr:sugar ABC transporter permease [Chloroflexota bacterium]
MERQAPNRPMQPHFVAYLFILPACVMYTLFYMYPMLELGRLSLLRWDGLGVQRYVGFNNYGQLLNDSIFWQALQHNIVWVIGAMIIPVTGGLMIAILLVRSKMKGKVLFRTLYFIPQVLSSVVVAIIWGWIYNPTYGAVSTVLTGIGLESILPATGILGSQDLALPALFIAWSWVHYGFTMVIFIAGLSNIDEVYFDAAKVDGATIWQQLRYVLLPFLRGPLTTAVLVTAISAFQVFDLVFVMTNGGPGRSTTVTTLYMINNAFFFQKVGYGATIAVVFSGILFTLSLLFLRLRNAFGDTA